MIMMQTCSSFAVCYCNPFGLGGFWWEVNVGCRRNWCGGLLRDGLERKLFFFASSSLIGNYEQQRLHICNVVRRFLLSFELFISAFCPQVLLSSWSTFSFLFTLFLGLNSAFGLIFGIQSLARQTMELEVTERDSETNIVHSLFLYHQD
jgi:hypothetical protein